MLNLLILLTLFLIFDPVIFTLFNNVIHTVFFCSFSRETQKISEWLWNVYIDYYGEILLPTENKSQINQVLLSLVAIQVCLLQIYMLAKVPLVLDFETKFIFFLSRVYVIRVKCENHASALT